MNTLPQLSSLIGLTLFSLSLFAQGPSTPEVQSFTPAGVTDLVDPFTGNFTYNIPLLEVGGYPINLTYRSGIQNEQQASWVGLGWNLNVGSIVRSVRGLPDDFKGDEVVKKQNLKDDQTIGFSTGGALELYGFDFLKFGSGINFGVSYNNYLGWDYEVSKSSTLSISNKVGDDKLSASLALESGFSRQGNSYLKPRAGLSVQQGDKNYQSTFGAGVGMSFNSRKGLEHVSFNTSFSSSATENIEQVLPFKSVFSLNYAHPTYTPTFNMPRTTFSFSGKINVGGEVVGLHPSGNVGGFAVLQRLKEKERTINAYGYLYAQHADVDDLMDVNREKDGAFHADSPNMPLPNFTHDVYRVSGQGISGEFRPFRGDIGVLYDPKQSTSSGGLATAVEVGVGYLTHVGVDLQPNWSEIESVKWGMRKLSGLFSFRDTSDLSPLYEPVYFKKVGELSTLSNPDFFDNIGGFDPVLVPLEGSAHLATEREAWSRTFSNSNQTRRLHREKRGTLFSYLTAREAQRIGLLRKNLELMDIGIDAGDSFSTGYGPQFRTSALVDDKRKAHHLSEITVSREDGIRYVYGIAAYNNFIEEVALNASGTTLDLNRNLAITVPNDLTPNNTRGRDNYYNSDRIPAHAYAHLLTAILSPDYVDVTGDGPTPDDLGTYTRFHYQKVHDAFRWRTPYEFGHYNPNNQSDKDDDLASFTYGEKEIWLLKGIETRNYFALFEFSDRKDGIGVKDRMGGYDIPSAQRLKKLDKITLYNRTELFEMGPDDAYPIKTVHLEYDYSLAEGIPDNTGEADGLGNGKLSLKKVAFSHGASNRSLLNPYEFTYEKNPDYQKNQVDRWGNYKALTTLELPTTSYFPFTAKDKATANENARAWNLSGIKTPTAGSISVEYESNAYAYVQDRQAMDMFRIIGFSDAPDGTIDNRLYDGAPRDYLFIQLNQNVNTPAEARRYVEGIKDLYFEAGVDINCTETDYDEEVISGFIDLGTTLNDPANYGIGASNDVIWIRLPRVARAGSVIPDLHPITKATMQKVYADLPGTINKCLNDEGDIEISGEQIIAFAGRFMDLMSTGGVATWGYENFSLDFTNKLRGQKVELPRSFVRLNNPNFEKFGGGSRVKAISFADNWDKMTGRPGQNFEYGLEYDYTMQKVVRGDTLTISSGVATYEPLLGGAENPFVQPIRFHEKRMLAADINLFNMEPYGESYFPAPTVGYRQVKVRNRQHAGVERTAAGFTLHEFYTAKDFPTIVESTTIQKDLPRAGNALQNTFNPFFKKEHAAVSQGYYIELNNMHGKMKGQKIFAQTDTLNPISGLTHYYKTDPLNDQRLNNQVAVIDSETGLVTQQHIGLEYELVVDARYSYQKTHAPGALVNVDGYLVGPIPVYIPVVIPQYEQSFTSYSGVAATKVIYRAGILERTVAFDKGAVSTTEHLLYHDLNGEVLVSSVNNEFRDQIYQTNLPAYWTYSQMGPGYINTGMYLHNITVSGGKLTQTGAGEYFKLGDELLLLSSEKAPPAVGSELSDSTYIWRQAWVMRVNGNTISLINKDGQPLSDEHYQWLKIVRSGNRNHTALKTGSISGRALPFQVDAAGLDFTEVLNAQTQTYSDHWPTYYNFTAPAPTSRCLCTERTDRLDQSISEAILSFIGQIGQNYAPIAAREENSFTGTFLPETDFNLGENTVYRIDAEGNLLLIYLTDTLRNNTCTIVLRADDGEDFPAGYFNIVNGSKMFLANSGITDCNDQQQFKFDLIDNLQETRTIIVQVSCLDILDCETVSEATPSVLCTPEFGATVNPFVNGILGNWRQRSTYAFMSDRVRTGRVRTDGPYEAFYVNAELLPSSVPLSPTGTDASNFWQRAQTSSAVDPFSKELQAEDALGNFSASLYGFNLQLPEAVAKNARHQEIAFDGFEDYGYSNPAETPICPDDGHWKLPESVTSGTTAGTVEIREDESHSGDHALWIGEGSVAIENLITDFDTKEYVSTDPCGHGNRLPPAADTYQIQDCDAIRYFAPTPGRYWVSAWVKEKTTTPVLDTAYEHAGISVQTHLPGAGATQVDFRPDGPMIDGWQQIRGEFLVPEGIHKISVILDGGSGADAWEVYFDDIRIHPFNAVMNTYVYEPDQLRLRAVLDEQNFATFYEYDQEGNLTRTERETEQGRITIQEITASRPYNSK